MARDPSRVSEEEGRKLRGVGPVAGIKETHFENLVIGHAYFFGCRRSNHKMLWDGLRRVRNSNFKSPSTPDPACQGRGSVLLREILRKTKKKLYYNYRRKPGIPFRHQAVIEY